MRVVSAPRRPPLQGVDIDGMPLPRVAPAREPAPGPLEQRSELEKSFPHAVGLIARCWSRPEAATRAFRALIVDDRGTVRRWPGPAWDELLFLRNLHHVAYPPALDAAGHVHGGLIDPSQFAEMELRYRHVVLRLIKCWGNVEAFAVVFHDLVIDDRGGRAGWPEDIWSDLVLLQQIHDRAYGPLRAGSEPWKGFFLKP